MLITASEINHDVSLYTEPFDYRHFEQYLRELDAPFDNMATLLVPTYSRILSS